MEFTSIYKSKAAPKKGIRIPTFLTLHKTHTTQTTKEAFPLILKKKQEIPQKILCHINSNS
jgi:hypothetical protein